MTVIPYNLSIETHYLVAATRAYMTMPPTTYAYFLPLKKRIWDLYKHVSHLHPVPYTSGITPS